MINKAIIIGRTGQDPDVKVFENGGKIAQFSLACTEPGFKTRDGKEILERTEWLNIVVKNGLATVVESYVKKGDQLYIEGKIITRSYEKDGQKMYRTEIHCDTLKMLGGKKSYSGTSSNENQNQDYSANKGQEQDDLPF